MKHTVIQEKLNNGKNKSQNAVSIRQKKKAILQQKRYL